MRKFIFNFMYYPCLYNFFNKEYFKNCKKKLMFLEYRQKQKNFAKISKQFGILAMRKFIFPVIILLLPTIATAQSGWYVQNSNTTSNLNDIFFINQNTGWAAGANGVIVKTTNSGFTWLNQGSGTTIELKKIQFINSQTGWTAGGMNNPKGPFCIFYSIILKTTNGGLNWENQAYSDFSSTYFSDLNIVDNNNIYLTSEGIDFSCMGAAGGVSYSTNSGIIWSGFNTGLNGSFAYKSLSFINNLTGYATAIYGSDVVYRLRKLLKTTNGGINWSIKTTDSSSGINSDYSFIRFFNENTGYYINGNFLKTTNAGDNWTKFDSLSVYGMNKFSFINQSTGYLVGQNKIVKTFDGGLNWKTNSGSTFTNLISVCSVDTNHVWACGSGGKIVYGGKEIVLDTVFAKYIPLKVGNTWTYIMDDPLVPPGIEVHKNTIFKDSVFNNHRYFYTNAYDGLSWIRYDSLTTNLLKYSPGSGCSVYPDDQIIDSIAASIGNNIANCGIYSVRRCADTASRNLFDIIIPGKRFYHDGLATNTTQYGKGFGVLERSSPSIPPFNYVSRLKGCVLDGVVYGDTSVFSPYKRYLPLQVGNSWTYVRRVIPSPDETFTITITGETTINGIKYYQTNAPFPSFTGNLITLDTMTGNVFTYNQFLNCPVNTYKELKDSLAAKKNNTFTSCNATFNGKCTDTSRGTIFGYNTQTKSFISPYYSSVDYGQRFAENFGLISAFEIEVDIVTYDLIKCTINGITYGDSLRSISGNIKFADNNQPATNGYVKAIKLNTANGNITTLDSAQIGINGSYSLTHLPLDSCDIVAYPNSENQSDFVPTFYPSTLSWQLAVKVYTGNNPEKVNVRVYRKDKMLGTYSISGLVSAQANSISGISGATVYIKQGNILRDYCITNALGNFSITNLPSGDYQVIADRLGYIGAQQNAVITISNQDNINFSLIPLFVGIHLISDILPVKFNLYQNYPNPFNPVTNIKFDVPKSSFVTIKIYNVLGKEVAVLLNEIKSAGSYAIDFDASHISSGVYFYRIETESFSETKRMMILK